MRAIVVKTPGPPEVLEIESRPIPEVKSGWVLVRVKAFGLNRSEMYTRQGHSGDAVTFPRVLGIECAGVIEHPSDSGLQQGQSVVALMGLMGREYDGGYAEYALLPVSQVVPVKTKLPWAELAAIPETFITAFGSVEKLDLKHGQIVLVRGGTSSVGMAATTIAKDLGAIVVATTRQASKRPALLDNGVDHVIIDDGNISANIKTLFPEGVDAVLELVGQPTLEDSIQCLKPNGIICQTGILGDKWDYWVTGFEGAPESIRREVYNSEEVTAANSGSTLQQIIDRVEEGRYKLNLDRVFEMEEIVEAHQIMEQSRAKGKLVVITH